ncbi:metallophosphoesterase family protein [Eggerthellaceae bacterium zg-997]|nr:metallophosphoesterase family protein [Eggerthellaceae bacterium zg-997]
MLVGVVSDTHGPLPDAAYYALYGCDAVVHAGDVCDPTVLRDLRAIPTVRQVWAVLGNNDLPGSLGSQVGRYACLQAAGAHLVVAHYPHHVAPSHWEAAGLNPSVAPPAVAIHGHTHVPDVRQLTSPQGPYLLMCPGSLRRPRGGWPCAVGFIEVRAGVASSARIETLQGEVLLTWLNPNRR